MTAETDITALDDGGENTALEARTAATSVLARADGVTPASWAVDLFTAASPDGDDDEFDDGSLDVAWTAAFTVTGSQTITEARDVLSVSVDSAITSGDYNAIIKPVSLGFGDVWETCVRIISDDAGSGLMSAAVMMSNGVTSASDLALIEVLTQDADLGQVTPLARAGTFTAATVDTTGPNIKMGYGLHYLRVEYDASNSFIVGYSPDGVSFFTVATISTTLTPTHVGVGWSTLSAAVNVGIASFEYIRKVA